MRIVVLGDQHLFSFNFRRIRSATSAACVRFAPAESHKLLTTDPPGNVLRTQGTAN